MQTALVQLLDEHLTDHEAGVLIDHFDADNDGRLNSKEFYRLISTSR